MNAIRNFIIGTAILALPALAPQEGRGAAVPDVVKLDSLVQLYGAVSFNHAAHIAAIKDCGTCHHHTTGTLVDDPNCVRCHRNSSATAIVACRDCHAKDPFAAGTLKEKTASAQLYHQDKPGLKGAYHQECMGCHAKVGGPTDCKSCHERNREGNLVYRSGEFTPKKTAAGNGHH